MLARELLIYLSVKYDGSWDAIMDAIKKREKFDPEKVEAAAKYADEALSLQARANYGILTCLDQEYPAWLKENMPAPFVVYIKDGELTSTPFKGLKKGD